MLETKQSRTVARHAAVVTSGQYAEGLSGMTCAIPAADITEVLRRQELEDVREKREKDIEKELKVRSLGPKAETARSSVPSVPPGSDENPTHREDFNSLLNAAARKREPKD
jgi:hypothetical protein